MSTATHPYTWKTLNSALMDMNEQECWDLIEEEKKGQCRINFMLRVYGRAQKLRSQREQGELLRHAAKKKPK